MKIIRNIIIGCTFVAVAGSASADRYNDNYTYAQVVDAQPIYETFEVPRNKRVCRDERRSRRHRDSGGSAVLGAIVGGILGNQFGRGHGREANTVAGVFAGAAIGANAGKHNRHDYNDNGYRKHCYTKTDYYEEQRLAGYDVSYEYNGQVYHARLNEHPGDRVRIQVNVQLAEY